MGLKSIAVYRDGSKVYQPLRDKKEKSLGDRIKDDIILITDGAINAANDIKNAMEENKYEYVSQAPQRRKLPDERRAITKKFRIADTRGYATVGFYEDNAIGEVFINVEGEGTTLAGLTDSFSIVTSMALQYGVPLKDIARKMMKQNFPPQGFTGDDDIKSAKSIVDYVFKWLLRLDERNRNSISYMNSSLTKEQIDVLDFNNKRIEAIEEAHKDAANSTLVFKDREIKICDECGHDMILQGNCYVCPYCGKSDGCS